MLTDVLNYSTEIFNDKFTTNSYLNDTWHVSLHYLVRYKCQKSEICIVINDKLQDSTAKHLSCDEFFKI